MTIPATQTTRRRGRLLLAALFAALAGATAVPAAAAAGSDDGDYVTTTTSTERRIDVSGFSPVCVRDTPYIEYTIVPIGFVPDDTNATMVIKDRNGNVIDTKEVDTLSGRFIFPGATIDANGNGTGWPGWKRAQDGSWIPDESTSLLRQGLTIEVTLPPSATAVVTYPANDSGCANPDGGSQCVPGPNGTCTPCYPGINNDSNPADDCTLATTGSSSTGSFISIGAAALVAGLLFLLASRRKPTTT